MMESMYKFAKYHYDCGNYAGTTSHLYFYLLVMSPSDKVNLFMCKILIFLIFKLFFRTI